MKLSRNPTAVYQRCGPVTPSDVIDVVERGFDPEATIVCRPEAVHHRSVQHRRRYSPIESGKKRSPPAIESQQKERCTKAPLQDRQTLGTCAHRLGGADGAVSAMADAAVDGAQSTLLTAAADLSASPVDQGMKGRPAPPSSAVASRESTGQTIEAGKRFIAVSPVCLAGSGWPWLVGDQQCSPRTLQHQK